MEDLKQTAHARAVSAMHLSNSFFFSFSPIFIFLRWNGFSKIWQVHFWLLFIKINQVLNHVFFFFHKCKCLSTSFLHLLICSSFALFVSLQLGCSSYLRHRFETYSTHANHPNLSKIPKEKKKT